MFRNGDRGLEVLLVHPGGPYFRSKDKGAWTIPKGEASENEDLLERALIEFEEELGIAVGDAAAIRPPRWLDLGRVKQKGGKTVCAWAFEGNLAAGFALMSNTFEAEWPPRSGRRQEFPEIDRAEFYLLEEAKEKINEAQAVFLDRLVEAIAQP